MHRNHQLRNQLVSTLNPDSMYHIAFKHDIQKNPRIQYQDKSQEQSIKIKTQTTMEDKGKFLSLVSKQKKGVKKGKSSKKTLLKKSHSVILGGTKQSKNSTNQSERSFQRSRCKSCTNLHQTNENRTPKSQTSIIQTPKNNILTQKNIPMNIITQPNENNLQLTKIISHKLKMDPIQPHQFFTQRINLIDNRGRQINLSNNAVRSGLDRRGGLLRNVSAGSVDRVYFTVGNSDFGGESIEESIQSRRRRLNLRVEKPLLTPRFDKTQEKGQRKRRQRAGFIRSASARKASPPKYQKNPSPLIQPYNQTTTTAFSPIQQQQQPNELTTTINPQKLTPKQQQIDQCITKMSLIRKQIDQIQSMIHQRLQSSQMRSKFIMNGSQQQSIMSNKNSSNNIKQQQQNERSSQLYTHRIDRDQNSNNDRGMKNSRLQLNESRSATTIVNDLNNLSRSLLTMSKCALMESGSKIQQRSNIMVNNNNTNSNNISSNGNSRYDSCYNNNFNNNNNNRNYPSQKVIGQQNNLLNLNEICNLIKHPHTNTHMHMHDNYNNIHHQQNHNQLLTQQLIEKQYVGGGYVNNNSVGSKVINNTNTNNYNTNTNSNLNPNPNTIINNNNKYNQENIINGSVNYPIVNNQQRNVFINRLR